MFLRQQENYSPRVCPEGQGQTITGNFYLSVLERPWKRIRRVRPQAVGFLFMTMHRAVAVQEFLARKQVCVLHHPPYCDYFLFPKLKLTIEGSPVLRCSRHPSSCDIESSGHTTWDVQRSFQSLLNRATRCIDAEGMHLE